MSTPVASGVSTDMSMISPAMVADLRNLPITDPNCNTTMCQAFYDKCLTQATGQDLYGAYTAGTYCFIILCFAIRYGRRLILNRYPIEPAPRTTFLQKLHSAHRFWSYRQTTGWVSRWLSISYGAAALWIGFSLLIVIACFAEHPYYRICTTWGMPPPMANRAGAMSASLTPLVVILAQKWNLLTFLTGITHDRLNVLHRTIAPTILFLAVVHTIPFFIYPMLPGGGGWAEVASHLNRPGSQEASGFAPLICLIFLCTLSIPYIRHRFYEGFVLPHIAGGVLYVGLLFWHTGVAKRTYRYYYATIAIWFLHMLGRVIFRVKRGGVAKIAVVQENVMHVTVVDPQPRHQRGVVLDPETHCKGGCACKGLGAEGKPKGLAAVTWHPGQHSFIRFPSLGLLQNHPFAITSTCRPPFPSLPDSDEYGTISERRAVLYGGERQPLNMGKTRTMEGPGKEGMVFLIKPQQGMTRKLMEAAVHDGMSELPVWIDGPYGGGHLVRLEARYDSVTLFAGGTGISGVLPLWETLAGLVINKHEVLSSGVRGAVRAKARETVLREVRLVWVLRSAECVDWVREIIERVMERSPEPNPGRRRCVRVEVHVTRPKGKIGRETLHIRTPPPDYNSSGPRSSQDDIEAGLRAGLASNAAPMGGRYESSEDILVDRMRSLGVEFRYGRPDIPDVVKEGLTTLRNCVIVCGPNQVVQQVANTAATCQSRVIKGEMQEVKLLAETFGW